MMRFNKKQGHFIAETIAQWEQDGTINAETAGTLRGSYTIRSFDWNRLAKYSFIIAIVCAIIAFSAVVADKYLVDLLMHYVDVLFSSSDAALSLIFGIMAAVVFYAGYVCRKKYPTRVFSNEAVLFCAVVLAASSIAFFGKAVDSGSGHFSLLLLIAAVLYGIIGLAFKSKLVWIFSLLSLGSWFGAETGYVSGWGAYFMGMNYPLRFAVFGAVLVVASLGGMRSGRLALFQRSTFKIGLLYLFLSLWLMSIFGNYGSMDSWYRAGRTELLHWSIIFGLVALAAIYHGLKYDDGASRGFGLTFLFINLYTKYFEYFWEDMHKAVFFFILAISFWLLGRKAEAIWNLEFIPKPGDGADKTE